MEILTNNWKAALLLVLVIAVGVVVGGLLDDKLYKMMTEKKVTPSKGAETTDIPVTTAEG